MCFVARERTSFWPQDVSEPDIGSLIEALPNKPFNTFCLSPVGNDFPQACPVQQPGLYWHGIACVGDQDDMHTGFPFLSYWYTNILMQCELAGEIHGLLVIEKL